MTVATFDNGGTRVGIAFQGGSFLAGAVHTGVVRAFNQQRVFEQSYQPHAFSGTSAGAIVAAVCWNSVLGKRFVEADDILTKLWMHNANSFIPTPEWGDFWKSFDSAARNNPLYDKAAELFRIPWLHEEFRQWISTYIDMDNAIQLLTENKEAANRPRLALGTADVLEGKVVTFSDEDFLGEWDMAFKAHPGDKKKAGEAASQFMLDALTASGSLDEINGTTTIDTPLHKGTYLDGAWGANPPISDMIDYGVDEIWIIEVFPKRRLSLPETHAQREDRKEELWQNSLVEQQVNMIRKVNGWLDDGRLINNNPKNRPYRPIEVRRMPMNLDFTPGARIVNSPSFLRDKMDYGYENALHFLSRIGWTSRASKAVMSARAQSVTPKTNNDLTLIIKGSHSCRNPLASKEA